MSATRDKKDIPKLGALIGKANAGPVTLHNVEYASGCLRFCGFESRHIGGKPGGGVQYGGVLKFELVSPSANHENRCLFNDLLAVAPKEQSPPPKRKRGA